MSPAKRKMLFNDKPRLNLPPIDADRLYADGTGEMIYDIIRRKWVALTPEEWVRQHFVDWLITVKGYSPYRIANEVGIKLNKMSRRCDTVVFGLTTHPFMIVEYKAPHVVVTQKVFDQIARYNMALQARILVVSNGMSHYCCEIDYSAGSYRFLPDVPDFHQIM